MILFVRLRFTNRTYGPFTEIVTCNLKISLASNIRITELPPRSESIFYRSPALIKPMGMLEAQCHPVALV
jgi:hypothetical protein